MHNTNVFSFQTEPISFSKVKICHLFVSEQIAKSIRTVLANGNKKPESEIKIILQKEDFLTLLKQK